VLGIGTAALVVVLLGSGGGDAPPEPVAAPAPAPAPELADLIVAQAPDPDRRALAELVDGPLDIALASARDYRERARFPRWSHSIADGVDPIERDRFITPGRSMPEDMRPVLVVVPRSANFEAPSPVVFEVRLEASPGVNVGPARLSGEVRDERLERVWTLDLRDDGEGQDRRPDDFVYTASFVPGEDGVPEMKGAYLVEVLAETPEGEPRSATTGFLYSVPLGRLSGRYRERVEGGNLVIECEVEVDEASRFHLEGTLSSADGVPIAWAQSAARLEAGPRWMPLTFFGLSIRASGRDGPYTLRSLALSTTGEMPNQKNEVVHNAFTTRAYPAKYFSAEPYDDPQLIDEAERLEGGASVGALEAEAP